MGFNEFQNIEAENISKLQNLKNEIFKNEENTYYTVILTHEELKKILCDRCPYPQADFKNRLLSAKRTENPKVCK
jgi:hypothetical protein